MVDGGKVLLALLCWPPLSLSQETPCSQPLTLYCIVILQLVIFALAARDLCSCSKGSLLLQLGIFALAARDLWFSSCWAELSCWSVLLYLMNVDSVISDLCYVFKRKVSCESRTLQITLIKIMDTDYR